MVIISPRRRKAREFLLLRIWPPCPLAVSIVRLDLWTANLCVTQTSSRPRLVSSDNTELLVDAIRVTSAIMILGCLGNISFFLIGDKGQKLSW